MFNLGLGGVCLEFVPFEHLTVDTAWTPNNISLLEPFSFYCKIELTF
jgi:hypothetical protein